MGQAKQRGTLEERVAQAQERERKLAEERRKRPPPKISPQAAFVLGLGAALGASLHRPYKRNE